MSTASLSSLVYCLWARPGAYPIVLHHKGSSIPALQTDIRLGWKGLPWTNTIGYYENSLITAVKSFITFGPGRNKLEGLSLPLPS